MSEYRNLTADDSELIFQTSRGSKGITVIVTSASTLGGGTLTIKTKPTGSGMDPETVDTLTAGYKQQLLIGAEMEVWLVLSGSTSPNAKISISELPN